MIKKRNKFGEDEDNFGQDRKEQIKKMTEKERNV